MKIIKIIFYATIICSLVNCNFFDIEKAESKKIVGKIYVINLNIPEDSGFYLIFRNKPAEDKYLLQDYEYVENLVGNDSILLIKTRIGSVNHYHLIEHRNGNLILRIENLSADNYKIKNKALKKRYYFVPLQPTSYFTSTCLIRNF